MENTHDTTDKKLQIIIKHHYKKISDFIQSHKINSSLIIFFSILLIYSFYFYLTLPDVDWLKNKNPKITSFMQQRIDEAADRGKKLKIYQRWVPFKTIPIKLRQAIRISEDAGFYLHQGIDIEEIKISFKKNWQKGKIVRGGSTITQQLAKNLFLSTDKSYLRKLKEYFIAKRLESSLSKNRIFHLYLNIIEFGRGIFGVQAASRYYFGKNVNQLTLREIVRLTAVIPKPLKVSPNSRKRWLKWKANWILKKLKLYHYITKEEYNYSLLR
jgi:monofunctional biosynthetic peptidoglycan transglycosylase